MGYEHMVGIAGEPLGFLSHQGSWAARVTGEINNSTFPPS